MTCTRQPQHPINPPTPKKPNSTTADDRFSIVRAIARKGLLAKIASTVAPAPAAAAYGTAAAAAQQQADGGAAATATFGGRQGERTPSLHSSPPRPFAAAPGGSAAHAAAAPASAAAIAFEPSSASEHGAELSKQLHPAGAPESAASSAPPFASAPGAAAAAAPAPTCSASEISALQARLDELRHAHAVVRATGEACGSAAAAVPGAASALAQAPGLQAEQLVELLAAAQRAAQEEQMGAATVLAAQLARGIEDGVAHLKAVLPRLVTCELEESAGGDQLLPARPADGGSRGRWAAGSPGAWERADAAGRAPRRRARRVGHSGSNFEAYTGELSSDTDGAADASGHPSTPPLPAALGPSASGLLGSLPGLPSEAGAAADVVRLSRELAQLRAALQEKLLRVAARAAALEGDPRAQARVRQLGLVAKAEVGGAELAKLQDGKPSSAAGAAAPTRPALHKPALWLT